MLTSRAARPAQYAEHTVSWSTGLQVPDAPASSRVALPCVVSAAALCDSWVESASHLSISCLRWELSRDVVPACHWWIHSPAEVERTGTLVESSTAIGHGPTGESNPIHEMIRTGHKVNKKTRQSVSSVVRSGLPLWPAGDQLCFCQLRLRSKIRWWMGSPRSRHVGEKLGCTLVRLLRLLAGWTQTGPELRSLTRV